MIVTLVTYLIQSLAEVFYCVGLISSGLGTLGLILLLMFVITHFKEVRKKGGSLLKAFLLTLVWLDVYMYLITVVTRIFS